MSSLSTSWLQKQTIDLKMAALLREIGEHKGRAELYGVQTLTVIESLREITAEHSAAAASRLDGIKNSFEQANYKKILLNIQEFAGKLPLSPDTIKNIHADLFAGTEAYEPRAGKCRSAAVDEQLSDLCRSYSKQEQKADPVLLTGAFILDLLCLSPFAAGNGRVAQLTVAWLLQRQGYGVSRFVSLERMVEATQRQYTLALGRSAAGWQDSCHDLRPWWRYWLKLLVRAYRDLTGRAQALARRKGVKTELVLDSMKSMPDGFSLRQVQRQVPGCGIELIRKICKEEKAAGRIQCLGRGPNALWRMLRAGE